MAKSQITFNKKENEKKRLKKRQDKQKKKDVRKSNPSGGDLDSMIAYVDQFGNFSSTPPDPSKKVEVDIESIEISVPQKEKEPEITERTGKIDFFNTSKGFGFIRELDTQEKYFFHVNGLIDAVSEGDKVTFELERGQKGMNAVKVTRVK